MITGLLVFVVTWVVTDDATFALMLGAIVWLAVT